MSQYTTTPIFKLSVTVQIGASINILYFLFGQIVTDNGLLNPTEQDVRKFIDDPNCAASAFVFERRLIATQLINPKWHSKNGCFKIFNVKIEEFQVLDVEAIRVKASHEG